MSAYYKDKVRPDGVEPSCKECKLLDKTKYYEDNALKIIKATTLYAKDNEKVKAYRKIFLKEYRLNNKAKCRHWIAKYRASKLQASPPWLTREHLDQIENVYKQSKKLEDFDGIQRHVDHIVPLQGKTVCGLHVPWNLQVLTKTENLKKNNNLEVINVTEKMGEALE